MKVRNELNKLTLLPVWLHSSVGRTSIRYRRVTENPLNMLKECFLSEGLHTFDSALAPHEKKNSSNTRRQFGDKSYLLKIWG